MKAPVGQVRGVLAESVIVSTPLDPFLSLKARAGYSGLSVRKLRDCLEDPHHPLPCYRIGGPDQLAYYPSDGVRADVSTRQGRRHDRSVRARAAPGA